MFYGHAFLNTHTKKAAQDPNTPQYDLIIVGGGLPGCTLAAALSATKLRVALVEAKLPAPAPAPVDRRVYALSPANVAALDDLGVWAQMAESSRTPVREMRVEGDGRGWLASALELSAWDSGAPELAWICEAAPLHTALWQQIHRQKNLDIFCPAAPTALQLDDGQSATLKLSDGRSLSSRLIVGADGVHSWVRKQAGLTATLLPYGETGIVCRFACEHPHDETAYQWFSKEGVMAWLPISNQSVSIVWSVEESHARQLMALDAQTFTQHVAEAGAHRLGAMRLIDQPAGFPLRTLTTRRRTGTRTALIGDAAHAVHPLTGHGVNLGLQDALALANIISALEFNQDCGAEFVLARYRRARAAHTLGLQCATHGLHELFQADCPLAQPLRNLGLNLVQRLPVVRDMLVRGALR